MLQADAAAKHTPIIRPSVRGVFSFAALMLSFAALRSMAVSNGQVLLLSGRAVFHRLPPGLSDALAALLSFAPSEPGEQVAQSRAVVAFEQILEARRNRVLLSGAVIAPVQWLVIFVLDALALFTI